MGEVVWLVGRLHARVGGWMVGWWVGVGRSGNKACKSTDRANGACPSLHP